MSSAETDLDSARAAANASSAQCSASCIAANSTMPAPPFNVWKARNASSRRSRSSGVFSSANRSSTALSTSSRDSIKNCANSSSMSNTAKQRRVLHERFCVQRLDDVEVRARGARGGDSLRRRLGARHQRGCRRQRETLGAQGLQKREAIHLRHVDVDDEEIEARRQKMLERFDSVESLGNLEAGAFESGPVIAPHESRVIYDQYPFRCVVGHAS